MFVPVISVQCPRGTNREESVLMIPSRYYIGEEESVLTIASSFPRGADHAESVLMLPSSHPRDAIEEEVSG